MTDMVQWFSSRERWNDAKALRWLSGPAYDGEPFGSEYPMLPTKDEEPVLSPSELERIEVEKRELAIDAMVREWAERISQ